MRKKVWIPTLASIIVSGLLLGFGVNMVSGEGYETTTIYDRKSIHLEDTPRLLEEWRTDFFWISQGISASRGDVFSGFFTANNNISFYILDSTQYTLYLGNIGFGPSDALYARTVSSDSFDYTVPYDDTFYFCLSNWWDHDLDKDIIFSLALKEPVQVGPQPSTGEGGDRISWLILGGIVTVGVLAAIGYILKK